MSTSNMAKELLDMWAFVAKDLNSEQQAKLREWLDPVVWQWGFLSPEEREDILDRLKIYAQDLIEGREGMLPEWTQVVTDAVEKRVKKSMFFGAIVGAIVGAIGMHLSMKGKK